MPPISSPEGNFLRRPQEHSIEFLNVDLGAPLVQNIFAFSSEENSRTIDTTSTASDISTFQTVSSKSVIYKEGQYSDWISNQDTPIDDQSTWTQSPSVEGPKSDRKRGTAHCSPSLISRLKYSLAIGYHSRPSSHGSASGSELALLYHDKSCHRHPVSNIADDNAVYYCRMSCSTKMAVVFAEEEESSDLEVFDDAIRSSYGGSIRLLFSIRSVAVIGALIVISSLAFSPMVQQMPDYPEKSFRKDTQLAVSKRARQSTQGGVAPDHMTATIQASILEPGLPQEYEPGCPKSNCTWDPFPSLSVCATCQTLQESNWTTNCGKTRNSDYNCSWNLPGVVTLPIEADFSPNGTAKGSIYLSSTNIPLNISAKHLGIGNPIINSASITFNRSEKTVLYEGPLIRSTLCSFSYCVQTLNVSVTSGNKARNQILHTWWNNTPTNADVRGHNQKYGDLVLRPSAEDLNLSVPLTDSIIEVPANLSIPGVPQSYHENNLPVNSTGNVFLVSWNSLYARETTCINSSTKALQ